MPQRQLSFFEVRRSAGHVRGSIAMELMAATLAHQAKRPLAEAGNSGPTFKLCPSGAVEVAL